MSEPEKKPLTLRERLKAAADSARKTGQTLLDNGKVLAEQATKTAKVVLDDAKETGGETLDTLGVLVNEPKKDGEAQKDLTLGERAEIARGHLSKTEWLKVAKDTAQDLRKPEELKRLGGTVIALPGGLAVYGAYRVAKHRKEKLAEEEAAAQKKKNKKPGRKPAP